MRIIRDPFLVEFYRKPISKKKRILAKWKKRQENYRPDAKHTYWSGDYCIAHPALAEIIERIDSGMNYQLGMWNKDVHEMVKSYCQKRDKEERDKVDFVDQLKRKIDRMLISRATQERGE